MASARSLRTAGVAALLAAAALPAQEPWEPPAPPCELKPGHRLVSDAIEHLTRAAEEEVEERRARRLDQAQEALVRAIQTQGQDGNPAAWYYLGRFYIIQEQPVLADSALRRALALAPACAEDIARYRRRLQPPVLADAVRQWQAGQVDSARGTFAFAASLDPEDANVPLFMAMMYADGDQLDSAKRYLERGFELAGDNPELARRRQQALLALARAHDRIVEREPATQRIAADRLARDTLHRAISRDSALLAKLIAEWAGRPLRPEVQQAVRRDSTTFARRLATAQAAVPEVRAALQRDSAAIARASDGAIAAYEQYHRQFPNDPTPTLRLLRLYSLAGRLEPMTDLIDQIGGSGGYSDDQLLQAGLNLYNDGHPAAAARLLEVARKQNPYSRGILFVLARAYAGLADAERLRQTAARLVDLDPLNRESLQLMAGAWELAGMRDSAATYMARADTGIAWAVAITQFSSSDNVTVANGSVVNVAGRPLPATTFVMEFLGRDGTVLARESVPIPPLAPRQQHVLSVRSAVGGAAGWRYRRQ